MPPLAYPIDGCAVWPLDHAGGPDGPAEQILLFRTVGRRRLELASNYPYELWLDGRFAGDGGLRCAAGEALLDRWDATRADSVVVRLHHMCPRRVPVLMRCLFDDPFFADLGDPAATAWECFEDASIGFAAKVCPQLPAQNIVRGPPFAGRKLPLGPAPLKHDWVALDVGLRPPRWVPVDVVAGPARTGTGTSDRSTAWTPLQANDVLDRARHAAGVAVQTVDLGQIGLHRLEVTSDQNVALCYSEVADFATAWSAPSRAKVHLADAVAAGEKAAAPFGTRGCRYVHLVAPPATRMTVRAWRREYPLAWKDAGCEPAMSDPTLRAIVAACRNNLIACVDGGIVDTCWRERAQWVGDLRMSAKAVRVLADDPEPVRLALRQIATSYDPATLMVQGAWPIRDPGYRGLLVPPFHVAFCLTVLENAADDANLMNLCRESLIDWGRTYLKDGLLRGLPGWYFVDWDATDPAAAGRHADKSARTITGPHAVTNAWYQEACAGFGVPTIDRNAFDRAFWMPEAGAYRLLEEGGPSPHATAATIVSLGTEQGLSYLANGDWSDRVTPYFGYFVAAALARLGRPVMLDFIRRHYGPSVERYGTIVERTDDTYSLAHGWSVGVAELICTAAADGSR